jgi:hypothetical protein
MVAAEFGTGQVFWSMLWFFLFFIWIWLLIAVFADIFRSDDLSGWGKALWTILVIVVPYLGVLIYLIVRGGKMRQREARDAQQADTAMRQYSRETAVRPCRRNRQARRPARPRRDRRDRVPERQGQAPHLIHDQAAPNALRPRSPDLGRSALGQSGPAARFAPRATGASTAVAVSSRVHRRRSSRAALSAGRTARRGCAGAGAYGHGHPRPVAPGPARSASFLVGLELALVGVDEQFNEQRVHGVLDSICRLIHGASR